MHACVCCHVQLFAAVACQALSMGFSQYSQEYWSALPCPPPGDLPDPGIECRSPVCPALAAGFFTTEPPTGVYFHCSYNKLENDI